MRGRWSDYSNLAHIACITFPHPNLSDNTTGYLANPAKNAGQAIDISGEKRTFIPLLLVESCLRMKSMVRPTMSSPIMKTSIIAFYP